MQHYMMLQFLNYATIKSRKEEIIYLFVNIKLFQMVNYLRTCILQSSLVKKKKLPPYVGFISMLYLNIFFVIKVYIFITYQIAQKIHYKFYIYFKNINMILQLKSENAYITSLVFIHSKNCISDCGAILKFCAYKLIYKHILDYIY